MSRIAPITEDYLRPLGERIMNLCVKQFGTSEGVLKGVKLVVNYSPPNRYKDVRELTVYRNHREIFAFSEDDDGTVFIGDYCTVGSINSLRKEFNI